MQLLIRFNLYFMKILVSGDFYPVRRAEKIMREGNYNYLLGEIKSYIENADYSIVNYESTFYGDKEEISKFGPNMATDEQSVDLAKWCGFNCFTLGNNHVHDYGDKGLKDMLSYISKVGIDAVGAGMNLDDAGLTLYKEICGEKVSFINCCEHEFNIANENHGGANPLNVVRQFYEIIEAKKNAKYVIVIVHGGSINCQLPSPRMQEQYRFFVDCGADAVINHHQHCFSGYEYYHGAPILYGLGNLFFDKPWLKNTTWTDGFMTNLCLVEGKFVVEIIPYTQCAEEARVIIKKDEDREKFEKKISELNKIIANPDNLKQEYYRWVDDNEQQCIDAMNVWHVVNNKYIKALAYRHWLPPITSDSIYLLNYLYCEAHLDRLLRYMKKKFNVQ